MRVSDRTGEGKACAASKQGCIFQSASAKANAAVGSLGRGPAPDDWASDTYAHDWASDTYAPSSSEYGWRQGESDVSPAPARPHV
eukprot:9301712-Pyramimonas_sp.AAC.1